MKRVLAAIALVVAASGCGYDGHYRYECQDPENWEDPTCNPPVCLVDNMCTEVLLGFDPNEITETTEITENTVSEDTQP